MRFLELSLPVLSLAAAAMAAPTALNTTREFKLISIVKPGQDDKCAFDGLYLTSYHTGAGISDATFTPHLNVSASAFLNETSSLGPAQAATATYPLNFDLGTTYPWTAEVANANNYAAWEPVRIEAGGIANNFGAFYINDTGLQWASSPKDMSYDQFGGWLVCDWWHGKPQLFARLAYYNVSTLSSCADIWLVPEYI
ncbi:hypothetical protein MBLNU457_4276t1 [Dothideomycetes sp. NU457]